MQNSLCQGLGVKESWALLGWHLCRRALEAAGWGVVAPGWPYPGLLSQLFTVSSEPASSRGSWVTNTSCQIPWHEKEGSNLGLLSFLWSFYNPCAGSKDQCLESASHSRADGGSRAALSSLGLLCVRVLLLPGHSPCVPGHASSPVPALWPEEHKRTCHLLRISWGVQMVLGTSIHALLTQCSPEVALFSPFYRQEG